jgi:hypothetical protein
MHYKGHQLLQNSKCCGASFSMLQESIIPHLVLRNLVQEHAANNIRGIFARDKAFDRYNNSVVATT